MKKINLLPLCGYENLHNTTLPLKNATVLNFWRWAFSNLLMNNVRGIFAEWMVGVLLDIPLSVRDAWQDYDLITPEGVTIEVKTSGYLQAWSQEKISKIIFSGLKSRRFNMATNKYADISTYNSDLYVFCVQIEKDPKQWDALNLEQWRFFLLRKEDLERLNQNSLSLSKLKQLSSEMTAEIFKIKAKALIEDIALSKKYLPEEEI